MKLKIPLCSKNVQNLVEIFSRKVNKQFYQEDLKKNYFILFTFWFKIENSVGQINVHNSFENFEIFEVNEQLYKENYFILFKFWFETINSVTKEKLKTHSKISKFFKSSQVQNF